MALLITAHYASGLKDTQVFGKQDPYVKCTVLPGGVSAKCKEDRKGGVAPKWTVNNEHAMTLPLHSAGCTHLRLEVWNDNVVSDDRIGFADLDLGLYIGATQQLVELPLQPKGLLCVTISHLEGWSAPPPPQPPPGAEQRGAAGGGGAAGGHVTYTASAGRLGGDAAAGAAAGMTPRQMAALAAEKRAGNWRQGGAADPSKSGALRVRSEQAALAGKIEAHYAGLHQDPPFGLMGSSVAVLKKHLAGLKGKEVGAAAASAEQAALQRLAGGAGRR